MEDSDLFTGIVEEVGRITEMQNHGRRIRLTVAGDRVLDRTSIGDSIAVNGICLTVVSLSSTGFSVDVMPETLRQTGLEGLRRDSPVNLERAVTPDGRMGGHIVSGHIDGTGVVASVRRDRNALRIRIRAKPDLLRYVVERGSIALDGVSLTVTEIVRDGFSVSVIPHSADHTVISGYRPGQTVNLECDQTGKYVERLLRSGSSQRTEGDRTGQGASGPLSLEQLRRYGF